VLKFLSVWAAFAALSIAWAIATPLGGSPDEPAHLIKAASVVRGQLIGDRTDRPAETETLVPESISDASSWTCYAFDASMTAACAPEAGNGLDLEAATTSAGLYQPLYYALVGWPSLFIADGEFAVLAMRAVSALLCSAFLATAYCALTRVRRGSLLLSLGFLAATTPMYFFLAGAVNPNAIEVAAGASLLALLLAQFRKGAAERMPWGDAVLIMASALLLATSRSMSPLWVGLIGLMALCFASRQRLGVLIRQPSVIGALVGVAAAVAVAGGWILFTGTLGAMGSFPGSDTPPLRALVEMLTGRAMDPGLVGVFGWLDTEAPRYVYAIWWALALGVVAFAVVQTRRARLLGVALGVIGVWVVPAVVQAISIASSGYVWQGRYELVAFAALLIFAAAVLAEEVDVGRRLAKLYILVAILVVIGQQVAYTAVLSRYAVGVGAGLLDMYRVPTWAPPGGIVVNVVFATVSAALLPVVLGWWSRAEIRRAKVVAT
jgi:hypothetical protein